MGVLERKLSCLSFCCLALLLFFGFAGCGGRADNVVQGYVEGEYVYVASPLAGALGTLSVQRGAQVTEGDPLFELTELG